MGVRGELFSARVHSKNDRRTYFFNLKENRNHDLFLTVVESKKQDGAETFDRHQIVVFEEDLGLFRKGLETVLEYIQSREGRPARFNRPDEEHRERSEAPPRYGSSREDSPRSNGPRAGGSRPGAPRAGGTRPRGGAPYGRPHKPGGNRRDASGGNRRDASGGSRRDTPRRDD